MSKEQKYAALDLGRRIYSIIYPRWWGGDGRLCEESVTKKVNHVKHDIVKVVEDKRRNAAGMDHRAHLDDRQM